MKYIYKLTLFASVVSTLILQGCQSEFDRLAVNPNQPSMNAYFTTPEAVNSAVMTLYGYVSTQRSMGASGSKIQIIRSDEASSNSDYGKPGMYGSSLNSSYYTIEQPFTLMYTTASQASFIIESIDNVKFGDSEQKNAYLGEAYFWRAFAHYFLLVNFRNISPMYRMPRNAADYVRPQESPEKVWNFIFEDLQKAKEFLPLKGYWGASRMGRVTKGAAASLLGKSYLYRSGIETHYGTDKTTFYTEAAKELGDVIDGKYGSYSLVDYSWNFDVAHENNDESILEFQFLGDVENANFNPGQATSGLAFDTRGIMLPGTGVGYEGVVHDWLYDAYAASIDRDGYTDQRMFATILFDDLDARIKLRPDQRLKGPGGFHFEEYYPAGNFSTAGNVRAHVYKAAILKGMDLSMPMRANTPSNITGVGAGVKEYIYNQPRAHGVNWRYIRYSDVLMMYAEAVVMGGTPTMISATEAFRRVRDRSNMSAGGAITMAEIKAERALEFALEGHRFYDLLRWGDLATRFQSLQSTDPNFKKFISDNDYEGFRANKHEWLPIPIKEVESNPYILQNNPGY